MRSLKGVVLKKLIDLSQPQRPRWLAKTLDDKNVFIKYDYGALTVQFEGQEDYVLDLHASQGGDLTTEVMLLLTGLSVMTS